MRIDKMNIAALTEMMLITIRSGPSKPLPREMFFQRDPGFRRPQ